MSKSLAVSGGFAPCGAVVDPGDQGQRTSWSSGLIDPQVPWPRGQSCAQALKPPPLAEMGAGAFRSRVQAVRPDWFAEAIGEGPAGSRLGRAFSLTLLARFAGLPGLALLAGLAALSPLVRTRWMVGDHDLHAQHPGMVADVISEFAALIED